MSHHGEHGQGGTPHTLIPIAQGIHADVLLDTHSLPPTHSNGDTHPASLVQLARRTENARVFKVVIAPGGGVSAARRPHDVVREVRVLRRAEHDNIVPLLAYTFSPTRTEHTLTLPLLAATMAEVFASLPPLPVTTDIESHASRTTPRLDLFTHVAQGLFSALEYLHARGMAHRDIKPANIMFAWDARPVLIDFGTAWDGGDDDGDGEMAFAVGTGPYRAPELLFSPAHYAAPALDLWASGAVLAELFRPHETDTDSDSASSDTHSDDSSTSPPPDMDPDPLEDPESHTAAGPAPLFDASFGEIGLAASIFRRLGTPTDETWPSFGDLPDAGKMLFDTRIPRGIGPALCLDGLDGGARETVLAVLEGLVRLEPAARVSAREVLGMLDGLPGVDVEQTIGPLIWSASRRYSI